MADVIYNKFKTGTLTGTYNLGSGGDTIKASFHTTSYTPNQDSDDFFDDATNEVTTSGSYTSGAAGGITLANKSVSQDNTDNEGVFDADDLSVTGFTGTFRWIVLRKDTGTAATSPLIAAIDTTTTSASGGTVTVTWAAEGIINLN